MSGLRGRINRTKAFFHDVFAEMRKTTWPHRQELVESTIVVIVSLLMMSAFVKLSDIVMERIIALIG